MNTNVCSGQIDAQGEHELAVDPIGSTLLSQELLESVVRVLLCPLASPGFVFPAIAVARALVRLGHEIGFVTSPPFRGLLASVDLRWLGGDEASAPHRWHEPDVAVAQAAQIEAALARFPADVLVGSALHLGSLLAGERVGLPVAVLGLLGRLPLDDPRLRDELGGALLRVRERAGMGPGDVSRYGGDLYLRRSVEELAGPPSPGTVLVGACTWEPPTPEPVRAWLEASELPVVLVQHARTFGGPGFWRQAMGLQGVRIAASTSRMDVQRGAVPPGALIAPFVPQEAVLARASVTVCSGTTTAALGALVHGVPAVVVPEGTEQHEVAATLVNAGVAVRVEAAELTVERLQEVVGAVRTDPGLRARAKELSRAFTGGAGRAARAIVALGREVRGVDPGRS